MESSCEGFISSEDPDLVQLPYILPPLLLFNIIFKKKTLLFVDLMF